MDDATHPSGEDDVSAILAEIERLAARPVAEVGVPMFLVAEDLAAAPEEAVPGGLAGAAASPLGAAFARAAALLERHRGQLATRDVARIVEMLADRDFGEPPAGPDARA